jgi:hypothetical protein
VNLHHAPLAVALTGIACGITAFFFQGQDVAAAFGNAAVFLLAVGAAPLIARTPPPDSSPLCPGCGRHRTSQEPHRDCTLECIEAYNAAAELQEEEDRWWRAIA